MTINLRPASFRGVSFEVESRTVTVGRRTATHEYPQRDIPWVEDMGRKARIYKLEAFIIGPDHVARRERLLAALEAKGAGQLVHPDYGTLSVKVADDSEITQTSAERGKVSLTVTFIEAGEDLYPRASPDTAAILTAAAEQSVAAEVDRFASSFSVVGGSAIQASAARDINVMLKRLGDAIGASVALSPDDMLALLPAPAKLGLTLANTIITGVVDVQLSVAVAADQWRRFDASDLLGLQRLQLLRRESGGESGVVGGREAANALALDDLLQGVVAAAILQSLAVHQYASVEDIETARMEMARAVDVVLYARSSDVDDLIAQRTAAIRHVAETSIGLPRLARLRLAQSLPAVVVAYERHGNLDHVDDLVARNRVVHPGFMPAGRDLSVLLV